jgi:hypothetical protein
MGDRNARWSGDRLSVVLVWDDKCLFLIICYFITFAFALASGRFLYSYSHHLSFVLCLNSACRIGCDADATIVINFIQQCLKLGKR